MSDTIEPYFTTYGELVEGQHWRPNVDNSWLTRGIGLTIPAGRAVQALPVPPKPVMVEVGADLLRRLVMDAARGDSQTSSVERSLLGADIADAIDAGVSR